MFRLASGASLVLAACLIAPAAHADVSSWLFVGAGPSRFDGGSQPRRDQATLQLDTGIGLPPRYAVVVGGLARVQPYFGSGADVALLLRLATRGYVNGGWGVALDGGAYERWWGVSSSGWTGSAGVGAPWGITAAVSMGFGADDVRTYSAVLGIDFARLTVYRTTGSTWWKNPFPAVRSGDVTE